MFDILGGELNHPFGIEIYGDLRVSALTIFLWGGEIMTSITVQVQSGGWACVSKCKYVCAIGCGVGAETGPVALAFVTSGSYAVGYK